MDPTRPNPLNKKKIWTRPDPTRGWTRVTDPCPTLYCLNIRTFKTSKNINCLWLITFLNWLWHRAVLRPICMGFLSALATCGGLSWLYASQFLGYVMHYCIVSLLLHRREWMRLVDTCVSWWSVMRQLVWQFLLCHRSRRKPPWM